MPIPCCGVWQDTQTHWHRIRALGGAGQQAVTSAPSLPPYSTSCFEESIAQGCVFQQEGNTLGFLCQCKP